LLPPLRNGETAMLQDPKIEAKETRPPPRYNEGTLIEAMQNAWRFVDDEVLRDRLKEAKGIGTPATRAEIIGGLKKQGFLIAQGKNIVPTETGLSLFGQVDGEAEGDRGRVDFLEQRHEAPQERSQDRRQDAETKDITPLGPRLPDHNRCPSENLNLGVIVMKSGRDHVSQ